MATLIPIVPITNLASAVFLVGLNVRYWKTARESTALSVKTFGYFLVGFMILMLTLSLPGLFVKNLSGAQAILNFSTLIYYPIFALFIRFLALSVNSSNKTLTHFIPVTLTSFGIVFFVLQMVALIPADYMVLPFNKSASFILYTDNSLSWTQIITGMVGFLTFGSGAMLFLLKGLRLEDSASRRRAFLIGSGCVAGLMACVSNSVFYIYPSYIIPFFLASLSALTSVILVFIGVLSRRDY